MLNDVIATVVASPLLFLVVIVVCMVDGLFPPMPSELTVVAALAASIAHGSSPWWVAGIVLVAALGATAGDSIVFWIGSATGRNRFRWMRRERVARLLDWLTLRLRQRPASLILVARYIPGARVLVSLLAGASGMRFRFYVSLAIFAGLAWAVICLLVATVAAAWLGDPLWSAVVASVMMLAVGLLIDLVAQRRRRKA